MSTVKETPADALARIQSRVSQNDFAAIMQFAACGISPDEITPRENVLTFKAWKALGRRVAKGATGQRVTVWVPVEKAGKPDGVRPINAVLFHVTQTIAEDAEKGTRPAAWENARLVKEGTYDAPAATPAQIERLNETLIDIDTEEEETESFTPEIVTISSPEDWSAYLADLAPEPMPAATPTAAPSPRKQLSMF
jgi:hypothetical protein